MSVLLDKFAWHLLTDADRAELRAAFDGGNYARARNILKSRKVPHIPLSDCCYLDAMVMIESYMRQKELL